MNFPNLDKKRKSDASVPRISSFLSSGVESLSTERKDSKTCGDLVKSSLTQNQLSLNITAKKGSLSSAIWMGVLFVKIALLDFNCILCFEPAKSSVGPIGYRHRDIHHHLHLLHPDISQSSINSHIHAISSLPPIYHTSSERGH